MPSKPQVGDEYRAYVFGGGRFRSSFEDDAEWFKFYGEVKEEIPVDYPVTHGKDLDIDAYIDAYYEVYRLTFCSHTVVLVFINLAPIIWYSKIQSTIESSTFVSEVVAMCTCL